MEKDNCGEWQQLAVKDEEKYDEVVDLADIIPLKLGRDRGGDEKDEFDDTTDAKTENKPPLPPKKQGGVITLAQPEVGLPSASGGQPWQDAGDVLQMSTCGQDEQGPADQEVSIHDVLQRPNEGTKPESSQSVKAFFGSVDEVDAGIDRAIPTYEYDMTHKRRGCFVIFNQMNFRSHLGVNTRTGTIRDAENLEETAKQLGFEFVKTFFDFKVKDILKWIKALSQSDHSKYDCFALAILTHGDQGDILYAKDEKFHLDQITEPFMASRCPSLAGKPKLFFIQACRGQQLDDGAKAGDTVDARLTQVSYKTEKEVMIIPNAADFLLAFSTVPGYYAWRNQSCGSWFIQALCKCLREFGDRLELMQIMTRVNRMVAYDFISYSKSNVAFHGKKQIPSIVTRLTHEVFFRDKRTQRHRTPPPLRPKHRLPIMEPKKLYPDGCTSEHVSKGVEGREENGQEMKESLV